MRVAKKNAVRDALFSVALFGSLGTAFAQAPAAPAAPSADQAKPDQNAAQEPSAKSASATDYGAGVFVDGSLAVAGAPSDTGTTPAKFSQRNDALDHLPIMARGPALSDAQRKLIIDSVKASPAASARVATGPAMSLPLGDEMQAWPQDIVSQVPGLRDTKYVNLADKVLVVLPNSRIVVEEITR